MKRLVLLFLFASACGDSPRDMSSRQDAGARADGSELADGAVADSGLVIGFDAGLSDSGHFDGGIGCSSSSGDPCSPTMRSCLMNANDQPANEACWHTYGTCVRDDYEGTASCYEADGDPEQAAFDRCCGTCARMRTECRAPFAFTAPNQVTDECDSRNITCREACGTPACSMDPY